MPGVEVTLRAWTVDYPPTLEFSTKSCDFGEFCTTKPA